MGAPRLFINLVRRYFCASVIAGVSSFAAPKATVRYTPLADLHPATRNYPLNEVVLPNADCTRVAYFARTNSKTFVFISGEPTRECLSAQDLWSTSAGFAFLEQRTNGWILHKNGKDLRAWPPAGKRTLRLSDDGRAIYVARSEGGKLFVAADETPGPEFDELLPRFSTSRGDVEYARALVLSTRGDVAYAARQGAKEIIVLNGKVIAEADELILPGDAPPFAFGPLGKNYAYGIRKAGELFVIVNGKQHGPYDDVLRYSFGNGIVQFSPDEQHFVARVRRGNSYFVVLDGKEMEGQVSEFVFSPDSQRRAFVRTYARDSAIVVDGKELPRFEESLLHLGFSPDSKNWFNIRLRKNSSDSEAFLDFNGKRTADYRVIAPLGLKFSPSGRIWACGAAKDDKGYIIINGRARRAMTDVDDDTITFSPDEKRCAFACAEEKGDNRHQFVVVDGKKLGPYDNLDFGVPEGRTIVFSPDSRRFAFAAERGGRDFIVIDGVEAPLEDSILHGTSLIFESPSRLRGLTYGPREIRRFDVEISR